MKVINCDKDAECVEFKEKVSTACYGAILLEDAHEWAMMRKALRKAKLLLRQMPEDQEVRFFVEEVNDGISVWA